MNFRTSVLEEGGFFGQVGRDHRGEKIEGNEILIVAKNRTWLLSSHTLWLASGETTIHSPDSPGKRKIAAHAQLNGSSMLSLACSNWHPQQLVSAVIMGVTIS